MTTNNNRQASVQQAVWRQSGCLFADSVVVIWKFTARRNLSEPPPERQAAGRCVQAAEARSREFRNHTEAAETQHSIYFFNLFLCYNLVV